MSKPAAPRMLDPVLARVLAHPTRNHIMCVTATRPASPREMAAELEEGVNNVSYHVEVLRELDCIELVEERPAAGGRVVEHVYRAKKLQIFDEEGWNQLSKKEKAEMIVPILSLQSKDLSDAIVANTFLNPDDGHVSRTPLIVDRDAWEEVKTILAEALDRLLELNRRTAARIDPADPELMAIKVQMLQFRSPDRDRHMPPQPG